MAGETTVGLLGKHTPTGYVADGPERVKASHVHMRQTHAGELLRVRHLFEEFDGPLPVPHRLRVVEHPLRGLGRAYPGRKFLHSTTGSGPVPGNLRCRRVVAARLQRPRHALMEDDSLTRQQLRGYCLGQQGMPRPVRAAAVGVGQQPRSRQLPKAAADILDIQSADSTQHCLIQRPGRHRQRRQHRAGRIAAANGPSHQQLRQTRRQPEPEAQHTVR